MANQQKPAAFMPPGLTPNQQRPAGSSSEGAGGSVAGAPAAPGSGEAPAALDLPEEVTRFALQAGTSLDTAAIEVRGCSRKYVTHRM